MGRLGPDRTGRILLRYHPLSSAMPRRDGPAGPASLGTAAHTVVSDRRIARVRPGRWSPTRHRQQSHGLAAQDRARAVVGVELAVDALDVLADRPGGDSQLP